MNALMLFLITEVVLGEYLVRNGYLPGVAKYLPEITSALVLLIVVVLGTKTRFQNLRPAYGFAFIGMLLIMVSGAIVNALEPGPAFAGIRGYFRALPLFFLPLVYSFTEKQLRSQMRLLLVLCLPQVPIAIQQRLQTEFKGGATGDYTAGTLGLSGDLSIFLISVVCVLTALVLRKRLGFWFFIVMFLIVIFPTTINETKVTFIMAPFALLVTSYVASKPGARVRNIVLGASFLAVFAAIFIPIYDYYASKRENITPIVEFLTDPDKFDSYMSMDAKVGSERVGRIDALLVPLREVMKEPQTLAFGFGLGNASHSSLGPNFVGKYYPRYGPFLKSAASILILELGLFGLATVLMIQWLIFTDARVVAREPGFYGALGVGWAGVAALFALVTFYSNVMQNPALSFLYWYFSGVLAAHRVALSREARAAEQVPAGLPTGSLLTRV
jgi:hypothetical protein